MHTDFHAMNMLHDDVQSSKPQKWTDLFIVFDPLNNRHPPPPRALKNMHFDCVISGLIIICSV